MATGELQTLIDASNATGDAINWGGGSGIFQVSGDNFGGATVALQGKIANSATFAWFGIANCSFTGNNASSFSWPPKGILRASVASANGNTEITAAIRTS